MPWRSVVLWPPCCPKCSDGEIAHFIRPIRFNPKGDDLYECWNVACSGYHAVYRTETGAFEPYLGNSSEDWEPPLGWPHPPQRTALQGPAATERAVPASVESAPAQRDATSPPMAECAGNGCAATSGRTKVQDSESSPSGQSSQEAAPDRPQNLAADIISTDSAAIPTSDDRGRAPKRGAGPMRRRRPRHPLHPVETDRGAGRPTIMQEAVEREPTVTNRATSGRRGKRTARLPSITEAQRQKIRAALCLGAGRESAAACARVPWAVFREWMARGEAQGRGQFHDFAMDVKQAEATAEVRDLAQLQPRPARDPRTAWPLLESRFPERWAKPPGR